jgi:adenosylhomocysteine nucleosidase
VTLGVVTGLAAEARLAGGLGDVLAGGGTPAGAAREAMELVRRGVSGLLSFGLAGGLDPALTPGTLVVPASVLEDGETFATDPALSARLGGITHPRLLAASAIVVRACDKHALHRATGAGAVDLETGAVARAAREAGLPFAVLRAVCDPADRDLPPAALVALDGAGIIGLGRLLRSLAARPDQLPALLRLARDAARARAALIRRVDDIRVGGGLVG